MRRWPAALAVALVCSSALSGCLCRNAWDELPDKDAVNGNIDAAEKALRSEQPPDCDRARRALVIARDVVDRWLADYPDAPGEDRRELRRYAYDQGRRVEYLRGEYAEKCPKAPVAAPKPAEKEPGRTTTGGTAPAQPGQTTSTTGTTGTTPTTEATTPTEETPPPEETPTDETPTEPSDGVEPDAGAEPDTSSP